MALEVLGQSELVNAGGIVVGGVVAYQILGAVVLRVVGLLRVLVVVLLDLRYFLLSYLNGGSQVAGSARLGPGFRTAQGLGHVVLVGSRPLLVMSLTGAAVLMQQDALTDVVFELA